MTQSDSTQTINPIGVILSLGSALVYALFIVIINRSKIINNISNSLLTFYALTVGAIILGKIILSDIHITTGLTGNMAWLNLCRSCDSSDCRINRYIGYCDTKHRRATKASVLGYLNPLQLFSLELLSLEKLTTNIIVGILLSIAAITFMIAKTKEDPAF